MTSAHSERPPAIFIMGPTAAGKTDLALALAEQANCQLISVDSALIYRGMDIGTAKPDATTLARAPHRLIDIRDPAESYSAADFRADALREMADIVAQGATPVLVGGTMLYFKVLYEGIAELPAANEQVRAEIEAMAAEAGWGRVHALLAEVDPEAAARIRPTDPQRLQRALEVYRVSGVPLTEWHRRQQGEGGSWGQGRDQFPYQVTALALCPPDRAVLHERIARRYHLMLEAGFEAEVRALHARGDLTEKHPAIRAVGYRQMWDYLEGRVTREQMIEQGIIATRQLAKRQITWLRSWKEAVWLDPADPNLLGRVLKMLP